MVKEGFGELLDFVFSELSSYMLVGLKTKFVFALESVEVEQAGSVSKEIFALSNYSFVFQTAMNCRTWNNKHNTGSILLSHRIEQPLNSNL